MKKFFVIVIFPVVGVILENCCGDTSIYSYNWTDIELHNMLMVYENEYTWETCEKSDDTVFIAGTYGISIDFNYKILADNILKKLNIIQSAYASNCERYNYLLQDKINHISIISLRSFDGTHQIGNDITDYFKVVWWGGFIAVNDGLNGANGINETKYTEEQLNPDYDLYLTKKPELDSLAQFEINIYFESGKILNETTDIVKIIN